MNLEDVVISVAQKEGWAVTIERKAETDIFFEFEKFTPKGKDFIFSVDTRNNSLGLLIDNILEYYQNYDPDYEAYLWIGPDGHGKMARHTILRILWRTWKLPRKWCINFTMFSAMSATNKQRKTPAKSLNTWQVLNP